MLALFAQRGAQPNDGGALAGLGIMVCFPLVFVAIGLAIHIMFLLSLSKCLKAISPQNRKMEPGQVWLILIPFFGIVWYVITVLRVSESLENEFEERGLRPDGDFGKIIGILGLVCGPIVILYWIKIVNYRKQLEAAGGGDRDPDDDEEEEERPRRRPRRRDEEEEDLDDEDDRPRRRR